MRELIAFEWYKIMKQKGMYLTAAVLLALILFFMLQMNVDSVSQGDIKKWEGPLTTEKLHQAQKAFDRSSGDGRGLLRGVLTAGMFHQDKAATLAQVKNQLGNLRHPDGYTYQRLRLEQSMLEHVHFDSFNYQWPVEQMQDYLNTYGFIFFGMIILVGLSPIFTREMSSGVEQYILSSRRGRKTIVYAKLIAALLFVLTVAAFSFSFDILFWILRAGNYGWHATVQSIPTYYNSPYSVNMLMFFFIKAGLQLFAGLMLAVFVLLISALSSNTLIAFISSSFIFWFPFAAKVFALFPGWPEQLLTLTYAGVMQVDGLLTEFQTVDFFGYPLLYPFAAVGLLILATLVWSLLLFYRQARKQIS